MVNWTLTIEYQVERNWSVEAATFDIPVASCYCTAPFWYMGHLTVTAEMQLAVT